MTKNKHHQRDREQKESGGAYWLYGRHAALAALANPLRKIRRVTATKQAAGEITAGAARTEVLEAKELERLLGEQAVHQGVAVLVEPLEKVPLEAILYRSPLEGEQPSDMRGVGGKTPPASTIAQERSVSAALPQGEGCLLILDQITDPQNVGAILRSAAAFDAAAVIFPKDHAAKESGALAKAASGALEIVPMVEVTNLARAIEDIKKAGYWVAGLDGEAKQTITEAKLSRKTALVLGAEGKGLRRLTAEHCDLLIKIPMSERMESLNVSNAAAVALYAVSVMPSS